MNVNQTQLAEILGVSTRQIRRWQDAGLPYSGDRTSRTYDTTEVVRWLLDRERERIREEAVEAEDGEALPTKAESKRRREAIRAKKAALDLAERQGRMVGRDTFREVLGEVLDGLRHVILQLPGRWAPRVVGIQSIREAEARLRELARELLAHLSGALPDVIEARAPAGPLPDDFPGASELRAAGVASIARVLEVDDLTSIDGVGPATAEAIQDRLREHGLSPPAEDGGGEG